MFRAIVGYTPGQESCMRCSRSQGRDFIVAGGENIADLPITAANIFTLCPGQGGASAISRTCERVIIWFIILARKTEPRKFFDLTIEISAGVVSSILPLDF